MGSKPVALVEEDLLCPVCRKALSGPGVLPKQKTKSRGVTRSTTKGRPPHQLNSYKASKETKVALTKVTKDNEDIIVARCGHLFHKFCLRHYCYIFRTREHTNSMCRVTCPICQRFIAMSSSQTVDYKSHQGFTTTVEKQFQKTFVMHTELSGQVDTSTKRLERMEDSTDKGENNLEVYRIHLNKLKQDIKAATMEKEKLDTLKHELDHTDRMLTFMQTQHLKIVRRFIRKVREKSPKDFLHFPRRLAPYLTFIEDDDKLVRDLGEVIVPIHLNNLKSDRQSLLKGILQTVNEKLNLACNFADNEESKESQAQGGARDKQIFVTVPRKDPEPVKLPQAPIVVKVRRSSISILSSTTLNRESIQEIVDNVKYVSFRPRKDLNNNPKKIEEKAKVENNSSSDDVKVIFMPQRPALQQYSEPCRVSKESDDFIAEVPKRRCRSTNAVLMRSYRGGKGQESRRESSSMLAANRSQSIANISIDKESVEKTEVLLIPPKTSKTAVQTPEVKVSKKEVNKTLSKKSSRQTQATQADGFLETLPPLPSIPWSTHETLKTPDFNNNFSRQSTNPFEIECMEWDKEKEPPPPRRTSLLEMIFDELEEEKNFLTSQSNANFGWSWSTDNKSEGNSPQFFRIDGKGMLHPESPYHASFRQPTFLSSDPKTDESCGYDEADEENQLNKLSHEERLLIAAEKETSSFNNYGSIGRRLQYHGIPACLGMPNGLHRYDPMKDPRYTPQYLRRWQQQLTSCRDYNKLPKYCISSPKLVNSRSRSEHCQVNQLSHQGSQGLCQEMQSSEVFDPNVLPPLTMFPCKRPTTQECYRRGAEGGDFNPSGEDFFFDLMFYT